MRRRVYQRVGEAFVTDSMRVRSLILTQSLSCALLSHIRDDLLRAVDQLLLLFRSSTLHRLQVAAGTTLKRASLDKSIVAERIVSVSSVKDIWSGRHSSVNRRQGRPVETLLNGNFGSALGLRRSFRDSQQINIGSDVQSVQQIKGKMM